MKVSWLVLSLLTVPGTCCGQDWGPWWVIGPFDHPQGAADIASVTSVERDLRLLGHDGHGAGLDRDHSAKGGVEVEWKEVAGSAGKLDCGPLLLAELFPPPSGAPGWNENAIAYMYRAIRCDRDLEIPVRMGSDDGLRCWLNGELLVDRAVARGLNVSDHSLVLNLKAGVNHLLAKVANGGGPGGYQLGAWSKIPQASVDQAIDRGVAMLLRHQLLDGSWAGQAGYGSGLSAYAGYCLLKSGLPVTHPAVQRCRAFVLANPSHFTYSVSCELLFLCGLGEKGLKATIQDRLDLLLDWQEGSGLWAYPVHPGGSVLPDDLSNTLYVALALRACEQAGISVSKRAWTRLLEGTLRCFEGLDARSPVTGPGSQAPAGFSYRPLGSPTGSMTTAGVSIIEICSQGLGGSLPGKFRGEALQARRAGLSWLAGNMNWGENPGQASAHHYFFIYGMERVGSILGLEHVGGLNWYWDGAQWLVRAQLGSGGWGGDENFVDTILGLLFLRRASAPISGPTAPKAQDRWAIEDSSAPVQIVASGGLGTSIWILGYSPDVRGRHEFEGEAERGPRVEQVAYFGRPKGSGEFLELGIIAGSPDEPASSGRYAVRYEFPRSGTWEVYAEVDVLVPPTEAGLLPGRGTLLSPLLEIQVPDALSPAQLAYASDRTASLLHGAALTSRASTQAGNQGPALAFDGGHDTRWLCDAGDASPRLEVGLSRPIKANRVMLSHAHPRSSRGGSPQAMEVEIVLNGKVRIPALMDPDPMRKTSVDLEADVRIRSLAILVKTVRNGALGSSTVGFAEVELHRVR